MLIAETQVAAQTEPYCIRLAPVKLVVRLRQSARIRRTVPISGPLEKNLPLVMRAAARGHAAREILALFVIGLVVIARFDLPTDAQLVTAVMSAGKTPGGYKIVSVNGVRATPKRDDTSAAWNMRRPVKLDVPHPLAGPR